MQNFCRRYRFQPFLKGVIFDFAFFCVLTKFFRCGYINYHETYLNAKFAKKTGKFQKLQTFLKFKIFKKWVIYAFAYYLYWKSQHFYTGFSFFWSIEANASFASNASFSIPNVILVQDSFRVCAVHKSKTLFCRRHACRVLTIVVLRPWQTHKLIVSQREVVAMLPLP